MITLIIKDGGEPSVIRLTYQNLYNETKDIDGAKIVVHEDWTKALDRVDTKYVCLVEPDCLVSSGYFSSLLGYLKKNAPELNKFAVLSSTTAVNNWAVRFYGYNLGNEFSDKVVPNRVKKSTKLPFYTLQIAYIPGAIIKTEFLKQILRETTLPNRWYDDLVYFSTQLSLGFWKHSWMVYLAPSPTYVTTEDYVNDIGDFKLKEAGLLSKFAKESI